jgi:hypothetical protein
MNNNKKTYTINEMFKMYVLAMSICNFTPQSCVDQIMANGGYIDPIKGENDQLEADMLWSSFERHLKEIGLK